MAVEKVNSTYTFGFNAPAETIAEAIKTNIINPFEINSDKTATEPLKKDSKGNLLFGNGVVNSEENCLSQKPIYKLSEKIGLNKLGNIAQQKISSYLRHVESWDNAVDPNAAAVIRANLPSLGDIQLAVNSNPRLLYLAQQANKDYI